MSFSCPICAVDFQSKQALYNHFETVPPSHADAYHIDQSLRNDKDWNEDLTPQDLLAIEWSLGKSYLFFIIFWATQSFFKQIQL